MDDLHAVRVVGPLGPYARGFAVELARLGFTRLSAQKKMGLAAHLSRWLRDAGLGVIVYSWDAPLVTLPSPASIRDYPVGQQVPDRSAVAAARETPVALRVTKRGALIVVGRRSYSRPHIP
ncbi:MAG: hypothetical protein JO115_06900 [Pseudonocardiales bacterium]|nr:hypothetical protein [Pseudonocardiales bacterium]